MTTDPDSVREIERNYVGDRMQSSLSRLAEWARSQKPPYEVSMTILEGENAIDRWTEIRKSDAH